MKLSAPTQVVFLLAIVLGALGLLAKFSVIAVLAPHAFWLALAGLVVLAAGALLKGV